MRFSCLSLAHWYRLWPAHCWFAWWCHCQNLGRWVDLWERHTDQLHQGLGIWAAVQGDNQKKGLAPDYIPWWALVLVLLLANMWLNIIAVCQLENIDCAYIHGAEVSILVDGRDKTYNGTAIKTPKTLLKVHTVNKLERDQLHTLNITVGKINQEDGSQFSCLEYTYSPSFTALQPGEAQFTELLASVNVNSPESTATPSAKGSVPTSKGLDESQPEWSTSNIAGSVAGGLVGVIIIIVLLVVLLCLKRTKSKCVETLSGAKNHKGEPLPSILKASASALHWLPWLNISTQYQLRNITPRQGLWALVCFLQVRLFHTASHTTIQHLQDYFWLQSVLPSLQIK